MSRERPSLIRFVRLVFTILVLAATPYAAGALNYNTKSVKGIMMAYGFVLGQDYTLSRIAKKFPDLSANVTLARAEFGSTFPHMEPQLKTELENAMGEKTFRQARASLKRHLQKTLARQRLTHRLAVQYLKTVEARSKGNIESPILEYLLAVHYGGHPAQEFLDGFRQRYRTGGLGKSQGVKLSIQLPRSWMAKNGNRPHIVKKWVSANGTGLEMIMLIISDVEGYEPNKHEIKQLVRSGEVKEFLPDRARDVSFGTFDLETRPGFWAKYTIRASRATMSVYQHVAAYYLFFQGKAIAITCQAGGVTKEKSKVDKRFEVDQPLCKQVLNSLVLEQAY